MANQNIFCKSVWIDMIHKLYSPPGTILFISFELLVKIIILKYV